MAVEQIRRGIDNLTGKSDEAKEEMEESADKPIDEMQEKAEGVTEAQGGGEPRPDLMEQGEDLADEAQEKLREAQDKAPDI
jgi:hypothetical protein